MSTQTTTETFAEIGIPVNPFPGLRPFEFDESHLFFGRDGQSEQLIGKLSRTHFLAVVGTSGSGKSSLVRAGFLPALHGGFMTSAGSAWRVAIVRPGNDPIGNLARALNAPDVFGSDIAENAAIQTAMAEASLRRGSLGLVDAVRQAVMPDDENLLVVVDQFEEIFRFARVAESEEYGNEAAGFVKLLLEASRQREIPIYVVLTMRSDYLGDCSQFWELPEAINESQYLIPRLTRDQLREAITGPVAVGGGRITPRLVNRLLNDVGDNQDQLPVLQHLLMRVWDESKEERLVVEFNEGGKAIARPHKEVHEGDAMDLCCAEAVGGMTQALSRHADEAFNDLPDARHQVVAEKLFKALTEKGPDNREIRRPIILGEICAVTGATATEAITVIETFRQPGRSFLMPPAGVALNSESLIDISHESLIRGWARLKDWVDEEARSARIYRRLAETAELHREARAGLWGDPDLQLALNWHEKNNPNQHWARRYYPGFEIAVAFLRASEKKRDDDIANRERQEQAEIQRAKRELDQALALAEAQQLRAKAEQQKAEEQQQRLEEQGRAASRLRRLMAGLVVVALLALASAAVAFMTYRRAEAASAEAINQKSIAIDEKEKAKNQKAVADEATQQAKEDRRSADTALRGAEAAQHQSAIAKQQAAIASQQAAIGKQQAEEATSVAEERLRYILAEQIAAQADIALNKDQDLERSVLLSVESLKRAWTTVGDAAWDQGMKLLPHPAEMKFAHDGDNISAIAYSPDGKLFAQGSSDGVVTLFQTSNAAEPVKSQLESKRPVKVIAFGQDGTWIAAASDSDLRVWDHNLKRPKSHQGFNAESIAFSPDGRYVAMANRRPVELLDTTTWRVVTHLVPAESDKSFAPEMMMCVAFSPDSRWLAVGNRGGTVAVWDVADFAKSADERLKPAAQASAGQTISNIRFSPKGNYLASNDISGAVDIWQVFTENEGKTLGLRKLAEGEKISGQHGLASAALLFSPDEFYIATGTGQIWDVRDGHEVSRIHLEKAIPAIAFSPVEAVFATAAGDVKFWKFEFGSEAQRLNHAGTVHTMDVSPGGQWLVTASVDGARVFRTTDWSLVATPGGAGDVASAVFSSNGRWLAIARGDRVVVFETTHWMAVKELIAPARVPASGSSPDDLSKVSAIGFSPDGRSLIAVYGSLVKLFEVGSWRETHAMGHRDKVEGVFFSPDGRLLATLGHHRPKGRHSETEERFVWNTANGLLVACATEKGEPLGIEKETNPSTDALMEAPCSALKGDKQQALLAEALTWKQSLKLEESSVTTKDGRWLMTVVDNMVTLRPLKAAEMIDAACARLRRLDLTPDERKRFIPDKEVAPTCPPRQP